MLEAFFSFLDGIPSYKHWSSRYHLCCWETDTSGPPELVVHDWGTAFIITDSNNWTHEMGIALQLRTAYSAWTKSKNGKQNQLTARY